MRWMAATDRISRVNEMNSVSLRGAKTVNNFRFSSVLHSPEPILTSWHLSWTKLRGARFLILGKNTKVSEGEQPEMKKVLIPFFAIALVLYLVPAAYAANWVYLGQAHVDGQHDHDNIDIGKAAGRYRFLQIRVRNAPIEFDRIVVHYGDGEPQVLQVRDVIRAGGKSRAIELQGDRFVKSFELWYGKARPGSGKPELDLFGQH